MTHRRYDLDWLRILAFTLLILYHIGMLYVADWGFHFKSVHTSSLLQNLMLLVNPWRMALLWMISGIATAYIFRKAGWLETLRSRTVRLLLPLAFGVWVIVPPQLWVEMSAAGDFSGSYWHFYRQFLDLDSAIFDGYTAGIWPHVDVNHLWYLRELWTFTLVLLLAMPLVGWLARQPWLHRLWLPAGGATVLVAIPTCLAALDLAAFPRLGEDGHRDALGLAFFLLGYLMTFQDRVWDALRRWRHWALGLACITYALFLVGFHILWVGSGGQLSTIGGIGVTVLDQFNRWFWLAALFGYAYEHLNRPHPWLPYLSPGIYPFYLVHQTLIIVLAFSVAAVELGPVLEPLVVVLGTFAGCVLTYEVARRVMPLRPLLGLKLHPDGPASPPRSGVRIAAAAIATLIIVPIGLEILL
ncbi:MAG: acyltransferase family protein [Pseudomonadota bacterium]